MTVCGDALHAFSVHAAGVTDQWRGSSWQIHVVFEALPGLLLVDGGAGGTIAGYGRAIAAALGSVRR